MKFIIRTDALLDVKPYVLIPPGRTDAVDPESVFFTHNRDEATRFENPKEAERWLPLLSNTSKTFVVIGVVD